ncbi:pseudaminic acid synthase [Arthrobacter subterraneus]|uniref:Pseudaminic acid synthase n=1 Tax=Arthrobacter subterraneus TaxID=335973 RepID=A0A1G8J5A5_9MICC|nr:pseudaminic acid synthase [Arthrobacter subterraneus]SDI26177.1 pseudaminic acid synthase [Arthrobacter subterraneus]
MKAIPVDTILIEQKSPPFVIAEMSGNHNGSLDRALQIVDAAADSGATAIKLQTYTPDSMTIQNDGERFKISANHALWGERSLYDLYEQAQTPWGWHQEIFRRARSRGLIPFSSPFDEAAVDLLEELDAPLYKIASLEIGDKALLERVAATGKPIILSNGASSFVEIAEAISVIRAVGNDQIVVLACTSSYPASPSEANLRTIPVLRDALGVQVGLSDHTMGIGVSVAAVALGATVIEKHVTLNRQDGGVDSEFSLEPAELRALVTETNAAWQALGSPTPTLTSGETESRRLKRSLYVVEDVNEGDQISSKNVRSIRPAGGLEPKHLAQVIGRTFPQPLKAGTPLTWEVL